MYALSLSLAHNLCGLSFLRRSAGRRQPSLWPSATIMPEVADHLGRVRTRLFFPSSTCAPSSSGRWHFLCSSTSSASPSPPMPKENYHETLENDWGVFFWRPPGFMCNWTSSPFRYAGVAYHNAEQAIMHRKALLFRDYMVAEKIMNTTDPRQQKALGRQVCGFDPNTWEQTIPALLFAILHAKFSQNQAFGRALVETGHKQLFESSPKDLIWGTGVSPQQAVLCSMEEARRWKGQNLLGKTLMKVRDALAGTSKQSTLSNSGMLPNE